MACSSPERIADTSMASVETTLEAARDKSANSSFLSTQRGQEWIALIELLTSCSTHHAAPIMVADIGMLRAHWTHNENLCHIRNKLVIGLPQARKILKR